VTARPGRCPIPTLPNGRYVPYGDWTRDEVEAYNGWQAASLSYWALVAGEFAKRFPSRRGLGFEQPGHVIYADYEDRSWAWLGATDDEHGDGPWAHGDPVWVGGYRYEPDSCAEVYTERVVIEVPEEDRDDPAAVAAVLAEAARRLGALEFTETA
jgi:hypothetical protein